MDERRKRKVRLLRLLHTLPESAFYLERTISEAELRRQLQMSLQAIQDRREQRLAWRPHAHEAAVRREIMHDPWYDKIT